MASFDTVKAKTAYTKLTDLHQKMEQEFSNIQSQFREMYSHWNCQNSAAILGACEKCVQEIQPMETKALEAFAEYTCSRAEAYGASMERTAKQIDSMQSQFK